MSRDKEARTERYSIRKFSAGAASVLIGLTFMTTNGTRTAQASEQQDQTVQTETQTQTTQQENVAGNAENSETDSQSGAAESENNQSQSSQEQSEENVTSEYKSLKDQYDSAQTEYNSAKKNFDDLNTSYQQEKSAYDKNSAEYQKLKEQAEASKESFEKDKETYEDKLKNYQKTETDYNNARDTFNKANDDYNAALDKFNTAKENFEKANAENSKYQTALKDYQTKRDEYSKQKSAFEETKAAYQTILSEYNSAKLAYEQTKSAYDAVKKSYNENPDVANYNSLKDQYESAKATFEEAKTSYNSAKDQYESAKSQAEYAKLQNQYSDLQKQYESALELYNTAQSAYEKIASQYEDAQKQYLPVSEAYEKISGDYTDALNNYNSLLPQYEELEEKYNAAQKALDTLQNELQDTEDKYQSAEKAHQATEDEYSTAYEKYTDAQNKLKAAQTAYDEAQKAHETAKESLTKAQTDYKNAKDKYDASLTGDLEGDWEKVNTAYGVAKTAYEKVQSLAKQINALVDDYNKNTDSIQALNTLVKNDLWRGSIDNEKLKNNESLFKQAQEAGLVDADGNFTVKNLKDDSNIINVLREAGIWTDITQNVNTLDKNSLVIVADPKGTYSLTTSKTDSEKNFNPTSENIGTVENYKDGPWGPLPGQNEARAAINKPNAAFVLNESKAVDGDFLLITYNLSDGNASNYAGTPIKKITMVFSDLVPTDRSKNVGVDKGSKITINDGKGNNNRPVIRLNVSSSNYSGDYAGYKRSNYGDPTQGFDYYNIGQVTVTIRFYDDKGNQITFDRPTYLTAGSLNSGDLSRSGDSKGHIYTEGVAALNGKGINIAESSISSHTISYIENGEDKSVDVLYSDRYNDIPASDTPGPNDATSRENAKKAGWSDYVFDNFSRWDSSANVNNERKIFGTGIIQVNSGEDKIAIRPINSYDINNLSDNLTDTAYLGQGAWFNWGSQLPNNVIVIPPSKVALPEEPVFNMEKPTNVKFDLEDSKLDELPDSNLQGLNTLKEIGDISFTEPNTDLEEMPSFEKPDPVEKPESVEILNLLSDKVTPVDPASPFVPNTPVPDEPVTPTIPDEPTTPDVPSQPEKPTVPTKPERPTPDKPGTFSVKPAHHTENNKSTVSVIPTSRKDNSTYSVKSATHIERDATKASRKEVASPAANYVAQKNKEGKLPQTGDSKSNGLLLLGLLTATAGVVGLEILKKMRN